MALDPKNIKVNGAGLAGFWKSWNMAQQQANQPVESTAVSSGQYYYDNFIAACQIDESMQWRDLPQDLQQNWERFAARVLEMAAPSLERFKPFLRHAPSCSTFGECSCGFATIELELGLL